MKSIILKNIQDHIDTINTIDPYTINKINNISKIFVKALKNNGKIFFCGNGGSAADAQHLTAEFLVRLKPNVNRNSIPAIALSSLDPSTFTAMINDYNPLDIFKRPFSSLSTKKDILFIISTSGNSKNLLQLVKFAKAKNYKVIGLLGNSGGLLKKYCSETIIIKSKVTARIQETHILIGHILAELTEASLFLKKK